jgi:hypothetical protein
MRCAIMRRTLLLPLLLLGIPTAQAAQTPFQATFKIVDWDGRECPIQLTYLVDDTKPDKAFNPASPFVIDEVPGSIVLAAVSPADDEVCKPFQIQSSYAGLGVTIVEWISPSDGERYKGEILIHIRQPAKLPNHSVSATSLVKQRGFYLSEEKVRAFQRAHWIALEAGREPPVLFEEGCGLVKKE